MSLDTVLLVAGVVLIGLEIVVPGGILGVIGLLSLTAGFFSSLAAAGMRFALLAALLRACGNLRAAVLVYTVHRQAGILLCCAKSRKTAKVIPARQIIPVI